MLWILFRFFQPQFSAFLKFRVGESRGIRFEGEDSRGCGFWFTAEGPQLPVWNMRWWVSDLECKISAFGPRVLDFESGVQGSGFGLRVSGSGFGF